MRTFLLSGCLALVLIGSPNSFAESTSNHSTKRWSARVFPVGLFLGEYMADLSFAPVSFFSVGAIGYHADLSMNGASVTGSGYGARAAFHFANGYFSDGWILSGYILMVPKVDASRVLGGTLLTTPTFDGSEYGVTIGKMWVWDAGFSSTLTIGAREMLHPQTINLTSSSSLTSQSISMKGGIRIEFALGWAF